MENSMQSTVAIPITNPTFNPSDYQHISGKGINVIKDLEEIAFVTGNTKNLYGANEYVDYISAYFENITFPKGNIPVMYIGNDDYIILEITPPSEEDWYKNHNLLHFTPYFFSSMIDGADPTIFGSVDDSLFFTKEYLTPGVPIKICMTASISVANYYQNQGYLISRIPSDFNQDENKSTFNFAVRVGVFGERLNDAHFENEYIKVDYYRYTKNTPSEHPKFTSEEIIASLEPAGPAPDTINCLPAKKFEEVKSLLDKSGLTGYSLAPYLSNYVTPPQDYAIKTFYDAIVQNPPTNAQADNTKENYFMSDPITALPKNQYLHILFANQRVMEAALTSNVQIYINSENSHKCISLPDGKSAVIPTSVNLPSFSVEDYPYWGDELTKDRPDYGICSIAMNDIISSNAGIEASGIIVVERFSYNPKTLNYTEYSACHTSKGYVGAAFTENQKEELQQLFPNLDLTNLAVQ